MSTNTFMCLPAPYNSLPIDSNGNSPPPGFQTSVLAQQGRKTPTKQVHLPLTHQEWPRKDETPDRSFMNNPSSYSSVILTESNLISGKSNLTPNARSGDDAENRYLTPERVVQSQMAPNTVKSTPKTYPVNSEKLPTFDSGKEYYHQDKLIEEQQLERDQWQRLRQQSLSGELKLPTQGHSQSTVTRQANQIPPHFGSSINNQQPIHEQHPQQPYNSIQGYSSPPYHQQFTLPQSHTQTPLFQPIQQNSPQYSSKVTPPKQNAVKQTPSEFHPRQDTIPSQQNQSRHYKSKNPQNNNEGQAKNPHQQHPQQQYNSQQSQLTKPDPSSKVQKLQPGHQQDPQRYQSQQEAHQKPPPFPNDNKNTQGVKHIPYQSNYVNQDYFRSNNSLLSSQNSRTYIDIESPKKQEQGNKSFNSDGIPQKNRSGVSSPPEKYDAPQFGQKNPFQKGHANQNLYNYVKKEPEDPNHPKRKQQQLPVQLQLHDEQSVVDMENDEAVEAHENETIKALVKDLQQKSRQLQEAQEQLRKQHDLVEQNNKLKKELVEAKQKQANQTYAHQPKDLVDENRQLRRELSEKANDFEQISEKMKELEQLCQQEIQNMHRKHQGELAHQAAQIEQLAKENDGLKDQVEALTDEVQCRESQIDEIQQEKSKLHDTHRETLLVNDHLKKQLREMIDQAKDIEQTDRALEENITRLAHDNQQLQHELKQSNEQGRLLYEENQLLEMELERTKVLSEVQQKDIETLQQMNQLLQHQLQQTKQLQQQPLKRSDDLEKQLTDLSDRLESMFRRSRQGETEDSERQNALEQNLRGDIKQMAELVQRKRDQMQSLKSLCQDIMDSNQ